MTPEKTALVGKHPLSRTVLESSVPGIRSGSADRCAWRRAPRPLAVQTLTFVSLGKAVTYGAIFA